MTHNSVRKLDTACFSTAIDDLSNALTTFKDALQEIKSQTKLLQGVWNGKGASKFNKAYDRLKQEFDDQSENLTAIRDDLQVMLETYEQWDAEAKNSIAENSIGQS